MKNPTNLIMNADMDVPELVPMEEYNSRKAKLKSCVHWVLDKAYGPGQWPAKLKHPFYMDDQGVEYMKPIVIEGLISASIYREACASIFGEPSSQWKGHLSIMQTLSRKGVYVMDSDESAVSEESLMQHAPFVLGSHLALIDSLMVAHASQIVTIEKVVQAVRRFATFAASTELPQHLEGALIFWLNKVCATVRQRLQPGVTSNEGDSAIPDVRDLLADINDGCCLAVVISFYCPDLLPINEVALGGVGGIADSLYNLQLVLSFFRSLPSRAASDLHLELADLFYTPDDLRPAIIAFLADLFQCLEGGEVAGSKGSGELMTNAGITKQRGHTAGSRSDITISGATKRSFQPTSESAPLFSSSASNVYSSGVAALPQPLLPRRLNQKRNPAMVNGDAMQAGLRSLSTSNCRDDVTSSQRGHVKAWEDQASLSRQHSTPVQKPQRSALPQRSELPPQRSSEPPPPQRSIPHASPSDTLSLLSNVSIETEGSIDMLDLPLKRGSQVRPAAADWRESDDDEEADRADSSGDEFHTPCVDGEPFADTVARLDQVAPPGQSTGNYTAFFIDGGDENGHVRTVPGHSYTIDRVATSTDGHSTHSNSPPPPQPLSTSSNPHRRLRSPDDRLAGRIAPPPPPPQGGARKSTSFAALPDQTTWQESARRRVGGACPTDAQTDKRDDRTSVDQESLRLRLGARRQQIENEKQRHEVQRQKQRQQLGKDAFIQVLSRGRDSGRGGEGAPADEDQTSSAPSRPAKTAGRRIHAEEAAAPPLSVKTNGAIGGAGVGGANEAIGGGGGGGSRVANGVVSAQRDSSLDRLNSSLSELQGEVLRLSLRRDKLQETSNRSDKRPLGGEPDEAGSQPPPPPPQQPHPATPTPPPPTTTVIPQNTHPPAAVQATHSMPTYPLPTTPTPPPSYPPMQAAPAAVFVPPPHQPNFSATYVHYAPNGAPMYASGVLPQGVYPAPGVYPPPGVYPSPGAQWQPMAPTYVPVSPLNQPHGDCSAAAAADVTDFSAQQAWVGRSPTTSQAPPIAPPTVPVSSSTPPVTPSVQPQSPLVSSPTSATTNAFFVSLPQASPSHHKVAPVQPVPAAVATTPARDLTVATATTELKNVSPGVGFVISDDSSNDAQGEPGVVEQRRQRFLKQQRRRHSGGEQDERRKKLELDNARKREMNRLKQEQQEQKRQEEKARREAIFTAYLERKAEREAALDPPPLPKLGGRGGGRDASDPTPPRSRAVERTRQRDGDGHVDRATSNASSNSSQDEGSSTSADYKLSCRVVGTAREQTNDTTFQLPLSGLTQRRAPSPEKRSARGTARPLALVGSVDVTEPTGQQMDYCGPKLFVKPSQKSNRHIIVNAVSHRCLAGVVNVDQKNTVLEAIAQSDSKHFIILFRDAGLQYRGLYTYNPDREDVFKIHGVGPKQLTSAMMERFYKYNSGAKSFSEVTSTKHLSATIDAVVLHNQLWQKKSVPRKPPTGQY